MTVKKAKKILKFRKANNGISPYYLRISWKPKRKAFNCLTYHGQIILTSL